MAKVFGTNSSRLSWVHVKSCSQMLLEMRAEREVLAAWNPLYNTL